MNYEKEIKLNPIIIDKETIETFFKCAQKSGLEIKITIKFKDGASYIDVTHDSFLTLDFKNKEVVAITSYTYVNNKEKFGGEIRVSLDLYSYIDCTLEYCAEDYNTYCILNTLFEEWSERNCKGKRHLYQLIHAPFVLDVIFTIIIMISVDGAYLLISKETRVGYVVAVSCIIGIFSPLIGMLFTIILQKSFPNIEFDIGTNKAKALRKKLLWIVATIFIPIIIDIISAFINIGS